MSLRTVIVAALVGLPLCLCANADTVVFSLTSPQAGVVSPGQTINWEISAEITAGGSAGLALFVVDFVQDGANPEFTDLLPADDVPSGLEGFSRPDGISNPGEGGSTTGYIGVQRGTSGSYDLHQIGGAQNSTGAAGSTIGLDVDLNAGVGLSGPVVIAQGTFAAPDAEGAYTYLLADAVANTFDVINTAPLPSPVSGADTVLTPASFQITVSAGSVLGDMNCDGEVTMADIPHFVQALVDPDAYISEHGGVPYPSCDINLADINQDPEGLENGEDIQSFVTLLLTL